ncbi:unannotated protein [freshwater metagenome]|uniref:Unannotated protein n=1 Tax=freshwater metagenome TaxID=449393 RepID=A0A6J7AL24_9ZZZZ
MALETPPPPPLPLLSPWLLSVEHELSLTVLLEPVVSVSESVCPPISVVESYNGISTVRPLACRTFLPHTCRLLLVAGLTAVATVMVVLPARKSIAPSLVSSQPPGTAAAGMPEEVPLVVAPATTLLVIDQEPRPSR